MSFASKTTKSDSSAVQLFRKDRMYPSSSSASGAVRGKNKEVENDAKKEKRKKRKKVRQTGKIRRVRDSRDTGGRAKDGLSSFLHPSPQRLFRGEKDEICSYLRLSSWRTMAQRGTGLHLLSRSPLCPSASPSSRCLEEERHSPNLWHSSRICSGAGGVNSKYE
jgi:hypothetical protein